MIYIIYFLLACNAVSIWYIHKLNRRLRTYEEEWMVIQEITDHNKDGDIIIHAKHTGAEVLKDKE